MIIDIHAHVCAAPELYQWKANQMSARGAHGFAPKKFTDEWVRDHPDTKRNLRVMDTVGTDVQFLSPRPFQLMHAEKPVKIMEAWAVANHDYIAQQVKASARSPKPRERPSRSASPKSTAASRIWDSLDS
jgi:hypothetical protein